MGADDQNPPTSFPFCMLPFQSVLLDRSPIPDAQIRPSLARFARGRRLRREKMELGIFKNYGFFSAASSRSEREKFLVFHFGIWCL
jgi:hypothetical protein